jgi:hypothetical protein
VQFFNYPLRRGQERAIPTALNNTDEVFGIFHWLNPSGRNKDLGSTLPLTEMGIRSIFWGGKGGPFVGKKTLQPPNADRLEILEAETSWSR